MRSPLWYGVVETKKKVVFFYFKMVLHQDRKKTVILIIRGLVAIKDTGLQSILIAWNYRSNDSY